jgi:predicted signal transduction protein with EAL and GGDEF domain
MWVVNVVLIFAAIAFVSWVLLNYGDELGQAFGVLFSGGQSILVAFGVLLIEAVKAAIIAAVVGGVFALIFFVAGAPKPTTQAVAISLACLAFFLLMIKALWENLNNLRWSIRHQIRNRYRNRR